MKYRFIIFDEDGDVYGINNIEQARSLAEDYIVLDVTTSQYISNGSFIKPWPEDSEDPEE